MLSFESNCLKIISLWQHRSTSFSLATVYRDDAGLLAKKTGSCCEGICFLSNATNQSVRASSWCNFLTLTSTLEWRTSCWCRGCNTSADRGAWVELGWKLGLIKSPALCTSAHDVSRTVLQYSAAERYVCGLLTQEIFTLEGAKEGKRNVVYCQKPFWSRPCCTDWEHLCHLKL